MEMTQWDEKGQVVAFSMEVDGCGSELREGWIL